MEIDMNSGRRLNPAEFLEERLRLLEHFVAQRIAEKAPENDRRYFIDLNERLLDAENSHRGNTALSAEFQAAVSNLVDLSKEMYETKERQRRDHHQRR